MSLTSSPNRAFRPEDNALKMFFSSTEESSGDSLSDFLNHELYGHNSINSKDLCTDVQNCSFSQDVFNPEKSDEHTSQKTRALEKTSPQPWRKGLWCLIPGNRSQLVVPRTRRNHSDIQKPVVSPSRLEANANSGLRSSQVTSTHSDTMTSPSFYQTKIRETRFQSQLNRSQQEYISSPKQEYSWSEANVDPFESWQALNIDLEDNTPVQISNLSAQTPSDRSFIASFDKDQLKQSNRTVYSSKARTFHGPPSIRPTMDRLTYDESSLKLQHPNVSMPIDDMASNTFREKPIVKYQHMEDDQLSPPKWTTESLHSSDSSHQSNPSQRSYLSQELSNTVGHSDSIWQQGWTSAPMAQQQSLRQIQTCYSNLAQPTPQRRPHQVLQQHNAIQNGLGIHFDPIEDVACAPFGEALTNQLTAPCAIHWSHSQNNPSHIDSLGSYPPLPPLPGQWKEISPFNTPRRRVKSTSRSPSPPISPTKIGSRSLRQRSPTRTDYSSQRRKSLHQSGPIKDATGKSSRARSASRPPRTPKTPKTPKTPGGGFGPIDFVNFTPKDAVKLLSDVAPSGSSKTRHRREQEAREKRKKLSEAALQAVRKAGGDVTALEEAFLDGVSDEDD